MLQQLVPPTYRDIVQNSSSLKKCLKYLATYCTNEDMHSKITRDRARKRKNTERYGRRRTVANEESTPVKKKLKLPCKVCAKTTHSTLLGCPQFKRYLPGQPNGASNLPKDVCRLCLGTIYRDCRHNGMRCYQDYVCRVSRRNFIICYLCRKHEKAQNWLRANHDPSMEVDNIGNMRIAIGYEHIQVRHQNSRKI